MRNAESVRDCDQYSLKIGNTDIEVKPAQLKAFFNFVRELGLEVKMALKQRFPDFELLEAFRKFSPVEIKKLPSEKALSTYGNDEIALLGEHYGETKQLSTVTRACLTKKT